MPSPEPPSPSRRFLEVVRSTAARLAREREPTPPPAAPTVPVPPPRKLH